LGARARVDVTHAPWRLTPFVNLLGYDYNRDLDAARLGSGDRVLHGYAGVDKRYARADRFWTVSGGVRRVDESHRLARDAVHGEVDAGAPLRHLGHAELQVFHREERKALATGEKRFRRLQSTLSWHLPPRLTLTLLYARDTEFSERLPPDYAGVEVLVRAADALSLKVFGGTLPGGLVCSSGTCRTLPPFSGVRAELELRI
jgi:hypothetical protein